MADRDTVVAMVTMADTPETVGTLVAALTDAVERGRGTPRPVAGSVVWALAPHVAMTPREAFFAHRESVPFDAAEGRVCAELVAPYPPGIPVLAPGEVVTAATLAALRAARSAGSRIAYAADPTLATLDVVAR